MTTIATKRTKIASWGNSEALRIPRSIMKAVGLSAGDAVGVTINERSHIEIIPQTSLHRRVKPAKNISYDSLFEDYAGNASDDAAWPDDNLIGAEYEAWSR